MFIFGWTLKFSLYVSVSFIIFRFKIFVVGCFLFSWILHFCSSKSHHTLLCNRKESFMHQSISFGGLNLNQYRLCFAIRLQALSTSIVSKFQFNIVIRIHKRNHCWMMTDIFISSSRCSNWYFYFFFAHFASINLLFF